jgi:23S rRNA pseudouridine1911/1915/1917 synthase
VVKHKKSWRRHTGPFRIIHEDEDIVVVDKDAGLLTVPIPKSKARNLKELLDRYLVKRKGRALQVHRIDRYTSGLVVFACHKEARERLVEQFRERTPDRLYLAIVRGVVEADKGTLRHQLLLTQEGFRQKVVPRGGTEAITHFHVRERLADVTLVEVRLETGLKNQIRVQFQAAGHPLMGDRHYEAAEAGERLLSRQALHSWRLSFLHPRTERPVGFESPLAADLAFLLNRIRNPLPVIDTPVIEKPVVLRPDIVKPIAAKPVIKVPTLDEPDTW